MIYNITFGNARAQIVIVNAEISYWIKISTMRRTFIRNFKCTYNSPSVMCMLVEDLAVLSWCIRTDSKAPKELYIPACVLKNFVLDPNKIIINCSLNIITVFCEIKIDLSFSNWKTKRYRRHSEIFETKCEIFFLI